jgi:hypothetical protein
VTDNEWHHVRIEVVRNTVTAAIDGTTVVSYDNLNRYANGRIGLKTINSGISLFDNVVVTRINLPGDFNSDGIYDCFDVNALVGRIAVGSPDLTYDLTGDGIVNRDDLTEWLAIAGAANLPSGNSYIYGDANLDGGVDGSDFNLWNTSKFSATADWCEGDFDADGFTDGADFNIWNANKFTSADKVSTVPEASLRLVAASAYMLPIVRRYRTRRSDRQHFCCTN